MPEFLLTDAPWIPCETLSGQRVELGLRDTLVRAHELRAVDDNSPLVTAALHRLLLAVLHRCFGPQDETAWLALYRAGRFQPQPVRAYLDKWQHRFDLLHPQRPFYQCVDENMLAFDADPPARLVLERSNYGAPVSLFQHRPADHDDAFSFSIAARLIVAFQAYVPGGLVRKPGEPPAAKAGPLNRGTICLVCGDSLYETLLLNLLPYRPADSEPVPGRADEDLPAWESSAVLRPENGPARGWLDLLTWQSRRLLLRVSPGRACVNGVVVAGGRGFDGSVRDPMMAWRHTEESGFLPLSLWPERALWRDSHALFLSSNAVRATERPKALSLLSSSRVRDLVGPERRFQLSTAGLAGKQARILLSRGERLPIPARLLADPDLGEAVRGALELAEKVGGILRSAVRQLARRTLSHGERQPAAEDVSRLVSGLGVETVYWAGLRAEFERFLERLPREDEEALAAFSQAVVDEAKAAFQRAENAIGRSGYQLHAAAEGGRLLGSLLAQLNAKEQST